MLFKMKIDLKTLKLQSLSVFNCYTRRYKCIAIKQGNILYSLKTHIYATGGIVNGLRRTGYHLTGYL